MRAAGEHYRRGAELARANGDLARLSAALYNLSFVGWGDPSGAELPPGARAWNEERQKLAEEALALARQSGDRMAIGRALWAVAMLEGEREDLSRSLELVSSAIEIFREIGDLFDLSWALQGLGLGRLRSGDLEKARVALDEQLTLLRETRDLVGVSVALGDQLELAMSEGRRDKAITLAGAAAAFRESLGGGLTDFTNLVNQRMLDITPADQGAWDAGVAMSLDDVVDFALRRE
jgi:non-specific serine/threonine protein kinase